MKELLCLFLSVLVIKVTMAQSVGIGTTTPDASAKLDISSTTQGFLMPTISSAQRSAIAGPATGLLVFQTDGTPGFCYYNGTSWINLANGYPLNSQGVAVSSNYGLTLTLAGNGSVGAADGAVTAASFNFPGGVATDISGNVYVADSYNNTIRKITPAGAVATLAGSGAAGAADGTGTAASFNSPEGVAADALGNVYVADTHNNTIRKITAAGVVTTFAGSGFPGAVDGAGPAASFNFPTGVAADASGMVYVADRLNHKIRKITPAGVVTTLAGSGSAGAADGAGAAASFNLPAGVASDALGNVYVADQFNHKIRKITPAGVVTTLAGSGSAGAADGAGAAASFNFPAAIAVDASGNVYVADYGNSKIRKITAAGVVTTLAGNGAAGFADGAGAAASFHYPNGIAVDGPGNVYVADTYNQLIRKILAH
ncbi:MAG TPA: NHL repeat-containing protein [Puia sp.]|nr:NHL repeat-containing protein [Puia sp.]